MTTTSRFIPKGARKVSDKSSDAVAYVYEMAGKFYAVVYFAKQNKPYLYNAFRTEAGREQAVIRAFEARRAIAAYKANRSTARRAGAANFVVEVGDIFHYSFGYDETHHVYHEVVEVRGKHAFLREIAQAQEDLGYDNRHRCMPQSGVFKGKTTRHLIQDGYIRIEGRYHARKWNNSEIAGVKLGPAYTGGGSH